MSCGMSMSYRREYDQAYRCPVCNGILPDGCICNKKPTRLIHEMVILELANRFGKKWHFIGVSREAIIEDVRNFGAQMTPVRELTIEEARAMRIQYLEDGIRTIQSGRQDSYKLLAP